MMVTQLMMELRPILKRKQTIVETLKSNSLVRWFSTAGLIAGGIICWLLFRWILKS